MNDICLHVYLLLFLSSILKLKAPFSFKSFINLNTNMIRFDFRIEVRWVLLKGVWHEIFGFKFFS
jgi:hypothetical protein